ncbi:MAG: hypothetical protein H6590_08345 [Flavobacteriales bacterium]|nr:hypothetical protein [Flavobacteriales bacterium]
MVWSNYAVLSYWLFMPHDAQAALNGSFLDAPLEAFHTVLIDGKFYSIFSMLFGIGFGFFLGKGSDGLWRFYRRMFILLVIGWIHLRYLWAGDILFLYAVLGLVLPLFRKLSDRALLITAAGLILSPIVSMRPWCSAMARSTRSVRCSAGTRHARRRRVAVPYLPCSPPRMEA